MGEMYLTKQDQTMLRKAVINRWPISEETRERAIASIKQILSLPDKTKYIDLKLKALRNLAIFDKINTQLCIATMPKQHFHMHVSDLTDEELEARIIEEARLIQQK